MSIPSRMTISEFDINPLISKRKEYLENMATREEQFEKMLSSVLSEYEDVLGKMEKLKAENKVKTVTYRQLMATKLTLQNIISRYEIYGLLDKKQ